MPRVGPHAWHRFEVDGVTYFWSAGHTRQKTQRGHWTPIEFLQVGRAPNDPSVGAPLPAGTIVTEEHARELVALMKSEGREV
jgi:hypothetical protein